MNIIHGTWIPDATNDFKNNGSFCVWVETSKKRRVQKKNINHPFALELPFA